MAKKSRTAVLKRQREAKKAEKAAMKREKRTLRENAEVGEPAKVATPDDLAGYGFAVEEAEAVEEPEPPIRDSMPVPRRRELVPAEAPSPFRRHPHRGTHETGPTIHPCLMNR